MSNQKLPLSVRIMQRTLAALNASNDKRDASLAENERAFREANPEYKSHKPIHFDEDTESRSAE